MMNKKLIRSFTALLAALVILGGFSVTAYAGGGDYYDEINDEPIPEETAEPQPLTPEGNMSLAAAPNAGGQHEPCGRHRGRSRRG